MAPKRIKKAPKSEQAICLNCGICCDGTLFNNAQLEAGEKGHLPEQIKRNYFIKDDKEFFQLPCPYFSGACTIYDQKKPIVCSAYRCKLLRDYSSRKMTSAMAKEIIRKALSMRMEITDLFSVLYSNINPSCFKDLVQKLDAITQQDFEAKDSQKDKEILLAKCMILEALLIKHFRPDKDFDSMIVK